MDCGPCQFSFELLIGAASKAACTNRVASNREASSCGHYGRDSWLGLVLSRRSCYNEAVREESVRQPGWQETGRLPVMGVPLEQSQCPVGSHAFDGSCRPNSPAELPSLAQRGILTQAATRQVSLAEESYCGLCILSLKHFPKAYLAAFPRSCSVEPQYPGRCKRCCTD